MFNRVGYSISLGAGVTGDINLTDVSAVGTVSAAVTDDPPGLQNGGFTKNPTRNSSASPMDLSGWRLADGNVIAPDLDGVNGRIDFTFPGGSVLGAGEYAVVWVGTNDPSRQADPSTALQFWLGHTDNRLRNAGDDLWLYDTSLEIVDYMAWGTGAGINTRPSPLAAFWDASAEAGLAVTPSGTSISLTPDGVDGHDSACWEFTTSDSSGCGPATIDTDSHAGRVASTGVRNTANEPPVLDPVGDMSGDEETLISFTATASDPDLADTLTFSLGGTVPSGAAITPGTGDFTWTPTEAQGPGAYTFDVVVTDDGSPNLNDSETITITVNEVPDGSGVVTVSTGIDHSCASQPDGSVWCSGDNNDGQLGDGSATDSLVPVQVSGPGGVGTLGNAIEVAVGSYHSCAVLGDNTAWCWGLGSKGQRGDGTLSDASVPVQLTGSAATGVVDLAAGDTHTCALRSNGRVWCTGENGSGQLGLADTVDRVQAVRVKGTDGTGALESIVSVGTGTDHSCAIDSGGGLLCWGDNINAQVGNGTTGGSQLWPTPVVGPGGVGFLSNVVAVDGGSDHTCAARSDGSAWCWGDNAFGQLGDGTTTDSSSPVQVVGPGGVGFLSAVVEVAGSKSHSCALKSDGSVWCWGSDNKGKLGDGTPDANSLTPVQVAGLGGVGFLSGVDALFDGAGDEKHSCAADSGGSVWCWGDGGKGQLGDGSGVDRSYPVLFL